MMAFILIQLFAGASQLKAQFRIVDEQDGKPVSGAYVFSSKGTLLCISDANGNVKLQEGMVTISNLAYEPLTVDAAKEKGTVCMKPKAYTLPEVAVDKAEYVKLSGEHSWSSLLSYRHVYNYDYRPLPTKAPIAAEEINDFVTTDVKTMTKEEAKAEMKDHSETDQFTMPDCLPAIPYDVAAETKDLLKKSFWEM